MIRPLYLNSLLVAFCIVILLYTVFGLYYACTGRLVPIFSLLMYFWPAMGCLIADSFRAGSLPNILQLNLKEDLTIPKWVSAFIAFAGWFVWIYTEAHVWIKSE